MVGYICCIWIYGVRFVDIIELNFFCLNGSFIFFLMKGRCGQLLIGLVKVNLFNNFSYQE